MNTEIRVRRPKEKKKQERAQRHTPLCRAIVSKTAKQTFQHHPAVKGADGQEIEQSQHQRRAGKNTRRLKSAPQRRGNCRAEQAEERRHTGLFQEQFPDSAYAGGDMIIPQGGKLDFFKDLYRRRESPH